MSALMSAMRSKASPPVWRAMESVAQPLLNSGRLQQCRRKERPPSIPLGVNRVLVGEVTVMSSMILEYTTTEPAPAPVVAQVEAAASTLTQTRDWWAEPLSVEQTTKL